MLLLPELHWFFSCATYMCNKSRTNRSKLVEFWLNAPGVCRIGKGQVSQDTTVQLTVQKLVRLGYR